MAIFNLIRAYIPESQNSVQWRIEPESDHDSPERKIENTKHVDWMRVGGCGVAENSNVIRQSEPQYQPIL